MEGVDPLTSYTHTLAASGTSCCIWGKDCSSHKTSTRTAISEFIELEWKHTILELDGLPKKKIRMKESKQCKLYKECFQVIGYGFHIIQQCKMALKWSEASACVKPTPIVFFLPLTCYLIIWYFCTSLSIKLLSRRMLFIMFKGKPWPLRTSMACIVTENKINNKRDSAYVKIKTVLGRGNTWELLYTCRWHQKPDSNCPAISWCSSLEGSHCKCCWVYSDTHFADTDFSRSVVPPKPLSRWIVTSKPCNGSVKQQGYFH